MKLNKIKKSYIIALTAILVFAFGALTVYADERKVYPLGNTVGITVKLNGVCVVSVTEFETKDNEVFSPAKEAGIEPEDVICEINGKEIDSVETLKKIIEECADKKMKVKILRNNIEREVELSAVQSKADEEYHIGVWIKDSSSGIGTMTFYDKSTGIFGALGHGICDEENILADISDGDVFVSEVNSVRKGEKGVPGELIAIFNDEDEEIGKVSNNTDCGIFGELTADFGLKPVVGEVPVASRDEIYEGEVTILSNIEGRNVSEYSAEIIKINKDVSDTRCMIIKITDDRLTEKTGGIIRGMSGSPIIQNGKLIGAVTHVFVNDPTRGYGIFIENMLVEAEKIK